MSIWEMKIEVEFERFSFSFCDFRQLLWLFIYLCLNNEKFCNLFILFSFLISHTTHVPKHLFIFNIMKSFTKIKVYFSFKINILFLFFDFLI
jgi:hypothetical protein